MPKKKVQTVQTLRLKDCKFSEVRTLRQECSSADHKNLDPKRMNYLKTTSSLS